MYKHKCPIQRDHSWRFKLRLHHVQLCKLTIEWQLYRLDTTQRLRQPDAESAYNVVKSTKSGSCRARCFHEVIVSDRY